MTFVLSGFMLYTFWVVMALIAIDYLAGIYRALRRNNFSLSNLADILTSVLYHVFPLLILASLVSIDPTGLVVLIVYYLAAIGVIFKYLIEIQKKL
ncbi:hypothetical protein LGQ02_11070 [Bacillus shivajii]|uniref:hypothetical protein n=1 Tax=Bacillus shivajii TaxID=1983719 RepID=UPI001CFB4052|nr:hypothetical protein [Bacillus shivajii]UCZ51425.1 hypothetical protein LGQ02_11070 [Bacillus shivajii]